MIHQGRQAATVQVADHGDQLVADVEVGHQAARFELADLDPQVGVDPLRLKLLPRDVRFGRMAVRRQRHPRGGVILRVADAPRAEQGETVLIVDDNPQNIELLQAFLESLPVKIVTAIDGVDALEKVQQHNPDLILLDVMMPKVDGWEMLQRVQEKHGVGAIPVIMFSGKVDEQWAP